MTRSASSIYDDDFFAWTQEQAAALRRLSPDIVGNTVDIAHVAEEIEDLGKRDLREVTSYLARLLEHLIKIDSCPTSRDVPHWRGEVLNFHTAALEAYSPSMRRALNIDQIWRTTRRRIDAVAETGLDAKMPERSPFEIDELLVEIFDIDSALPRLGGAHSLDKRS